MLALSKLELTREVEVDRGVLRWRGKLCPSPISETYELSLTYEGGYRVPTIHVLSPDLHAEGVDDLPHVYGDDELCLCYPHEFKPQILIAKTMIPWASEWLLHFEFFQVTGEWSGGGHDPAVAPR